MDHLSIGDFARESGLSAKALRLYDELELLPPAAVDPFTGYRRYARDQLERARLVARLRLIGMPLARIRLVLELAGPLAAAEVTAYWRQVLAETSARDEMVQVLLRELRQEEISMQAPQDFTLTSATRLGQGARESQQDAAYVGRSLFAVADGFGDGRGDQTVSARVIEVIAGLDEAESSADPDTALAEAVQATAQATAGRDGGSTITAIWLHDGRLWIAHVGDGRVWRVREGQVDQLTRDHTLVASLIEEGRLTEDEARSHPRRSVLNRAVADGEGEVDLSEADVLPGDRFVLTTDGVHSVVEPAWLSGALCSADSPDGVVEAVGAAVERAGAPDNYAVVVVELDPVSCAPETPAPAR